MLLLPVGGRSAAMGRALTAWGSPDAMFTNPAGLAELDEGQLVIHHEPLIEDQQANTFSAIMTPASVGTLALTYQFYDYGEEDARDIFGNTTGRLSTREQVLIASFATDVGGGVTAGLNYKLYQFRVDCSGYCPGGGFAGTTHALDVGVRFRTGALPHVQLGAALVNVGFPLQVINAAQADPLPSRLRLGGAYELLHHFPVESPLELWLTADVETRITDPGVRQVAIAAELSAAKSVFVRAGFRTGEGRGTGAAVGVGLEYDRFTMAVSRSFATTDLQLDYEPFQFTFGIEF